jgi:hypothetical protein
VALTGLAFQAPWGRLTTFPHVAFYLSIAGEVLVLGRMAYSGLVRTYRYFSLYLVSSVVIDLLGLLFDRGTRGYALFFMIATSLLAVLLLATVLELYNRIIQRFAGLGYLGGRVLAAAAATGILISAGIALVDAKALPSTGLLGIAVFCQRWLLSVAAVVLVIASRFFFRYRSVMTRNLVVHTKVLTLYCAITAAAFFSTNLRADPALVSALFLSGYFLCQCLWIGLLSKAGEHLTAPPSTPEQIEEARLSRQQMEKLLDDLERPDRDDQGGGPKPE